MAYRNIKKNKGSRTSGTNNNTIINIGDKDNDKLIRYVKSRLANYQPHTIKRVEIPKSNGKIRPLGIPTIEDRLIQQCIKQVLEPICEAKFYDHSYGFRPNRSAHHALARFNHLVNKGNLYYSVDIDIKSFFDNVNHGKLLKQMWSFGIQDKKLISVISKMLKAEVKGIGTTTKGTPQGGVLSPLLSNIVLNELDWWVSSQWENMKTRHDYGESQTSKLTGRKIVHRSHKYRALKTTKLKQIFVVRYCDDFKILCSNYNVAKKIFIATKAWLKDRLDLDINDEKSHITNLKKKCTEFLGFEIKAEPKANKYVARSHINKKAKERIKLEVRELAKRIQCSPISNEANKYNATVLGWHNYYKYATAVNLDFKDIHFSVIKTLYNRFKRGSSKQGYKSKAYMKYYGNYNFKTYFIGGIALYPLVGVVTETARSFTQQKCNYTEEGRTLIHDKVMINSKILKYIMIHPIQSQSTEYNDNRISLYVGQNGKCGVTGNQLNISDMEVHHKIPKKLGGTDEYSNLIYVNKTVHTLIHATQMDTISDYLNKLEFTAKLLDKVNKLRLKAGNNLIV